MTRLLAPFAVLLCLAAPAAAQEITAETDHILWCASAFALLANDASEQNDADDTALYDRLAATLTEQGIALLRQQQLRDDRIGAIIQAYDDLVYTQFDTEKARYPLEGCELLVQG